MKNMLDQIVLWLVLTAGATFMLVVMWAFFGLVGIAEGSTDLCTETFRAATTGGGR